MKKEKFLLFAHSAKKLATNKNFMAYILSQYAELNSISEEQIIAYLQCTSEQYFTLALCDRLDIHNSNYITDLQDLAEITKIDKEKLNDLIKNVDIILSYVDNSDEKQQYLMAARDKIDNNKNNNEI